MLITSLDNKKIKTYLSLKDKKFRDKLNLFIVEGMHLVKEAYRNNYLVELLVLDGENIDFEVDVPLIYVTLPVLKKLSSLTSQSKVIGLAKMPNDSEIKGNKLLILDNIQDPGNLGSMIRSAVAFNVDTILLSDDSVDLYNDKVIRASQGMIFSSNIVRSPLLSVISGLKEKNYLIVGTDVRKGARIEKLKFSKVALIIGNEGNGIKGDLLKECDQFVHIDMNLDCESLNASVSAGILLYEINRIHHE